ncbi:NAD(P)/FAD-dependent oxidoreductase [Microbacterium sp. gxy059]|uniref:NAD(P)/FAD-dependent oxidoreductase n=1 Tax=Microbacterium sp. gxy059 TaxID=2957199 RepID=UPI003D97E998
MEPQNDIPWDAIVVGGGPAGLSAALMLGRARRRVLVVDGGSPRNRFADRMHGVLGHEGLPPADLARRGRDECAGYGVRFAEGSVAGVADLEGGVSVSLEDGATQRARALIVATGLSDHLPPVPGLAERWGRTVLHCPYCHGHEVADRRLGVLAASPMAMHQAQLVRQWSDDVVLFSAGMGPVAVEDEQRLRARGIEIVGSPVVEVAGDGDRIDAVVTDDGRRTSVDAIFTAATPRPHDGFLDALDLPRTEVPFAAVSVLETDPTGRTAHPRIWAAGNVVSPMANVPAAMGAGSFTGAAVNGALVEEEFDRAAA